MEDGLVLKTITDFDFGVGGSNKDFSRVSDVFVDVTACEINLITWLLLEQEFSKVKDAVAQGAYGDSTDAAAAAAAAGTKTIQSNAGFKSQAKRYAEDLLRAVGVSVPFELLSSSRREELFRLFSSHSNLLRNEKFRSILDLYEALRRRSKFREEFDVVGTVGSGEFGSVFSVIHRKLKENLYLNKFALKQIAISSFDALDSINMVINESVILQKLHEHPNIIQHIDSWLEVDEQNSETLVFYLQMELCDIPLSRWREENPQEKLSPNHLLFISKQLFDALNWIHRNNCLHLDINPKNILWADRTRQSVKIADFGLSVPRISYHGRDGTVPYCAPENILNPKSDLYSLGVTLFEISQTFSTRAELIKRIDLRDFHTAVPFLSVQVHETGKRHQENARQRLREIHQKARSNEKEKKKMASTLRRINEAASAAVAQDKESNPDMSLKIESYMEYMKEQEVALGGPQTTNKETKSELKILHRDEKYSNDDSVPPNPRPYTSRFGGWTSTTSTQKQDFELPSSSYSVKTGKSKKVKAVNNFGIPEPEVIYTPKVKEKRKHIFEEKTLTSLSKISESVSSQFVKVEPTISDVSFKKRKFSKSNARQRIDD